MKSRAQLIKRVHELKGELSIVERELAKSYSMYWSSELGWVTIPGPELDDEIAALSSDDETNRGDS